MNSLTGTRLDSTPVESSQYGSNSKNQGSYKKNLKLTEKPSSTFLCCPGILKGPQAKTASKVSEAARKSQRLNPQSADTTALATSSAKTRAVKKQAVKKLGKKAARNSAGNETFPTKKRPQKASQEEVKAHFGKKVQDEIAICYQLISDFYDGTNGKERDYEKAIQYCKKFLKIAKEDDFTARANVLYILCCCHFALEKVNDETKKYLARAIDLFPNFINEQLKGAILLLQGDCLALVFQDHVKAVQVYKEAQTKKIDDCVLKVRNHYSLGICLQKTGGAIKEIQHEFKEAYILINRYRPSKDQGCAEKNDLLAKIEKSLQEVNLSPFKTPNSQVRFKTIT